MQWIRNRKNFKTELHEEVETTIACPFLKESIINELATLHNTLCESIDLINNCFSVQVTADLASVMFYNIFCLFGIYHLIMAKATMFEEIALCTLNTSWNLYYTVFTSIMVACCGMVTEEVRLMIYLQNADHRSSEDVFIKYSWNFSLLTRYLIINFSVD